MTRDRRPLLGLVAVAALALGCGDPGTAPSRPLAPSPVVSSAAASNEALINSIVGAVLADASAEQDRLVRAEVDAAVAGDVSVD